MGNCSPSTKQPYPNLEGNFLCTNPSSFVTKGFFFICHMYLLHVKLLKCFTYLHDAFGGSWLNSPISCFLSGFVKSSFSRLVVFPTQITLIIKADVTLLLSGPLRMYIYLVTCSGRVVHLLFVCFHEYQPGNIYQGVTFLLT